MSVLAGPHTRWATGGNDWLNWHELYRRDRLVGRIIEWYPTGTRYTLFFIGPRLGAVRLRDKHIRTLDSAKQLIERLANADDEVDPRIQLAQIESHEIDGKTFISAEGIEVLLCTLAGQFLLQGQTEATMDQFRQIIQSLTEIQ